MRPEGRDDLRHALALHRSGRLREAAAAYRSILIEYPRHADALHLLGLVTHQGGDHAGALRHIDAAIAVDDQVAEYHCNRGSVLLRLGRAADAETGFRRALEIRPRYAEAHNGLGNTLQDLGRLEEAVACYRAALALRPDLAEAHNNLGNALHRLGRTETALGHYRQALARRPSYVEAACNLGAALSDLGELAGALASYRDALERKPDHAPAWRGMAGVHREQGAFAEALASLRRAVAADPGRVRYRLDLGDLLGELRRFDDARACFDDILRRWPATIEAHLGLARVAREAGDIEAARRHCAEALAIDPDCVDALRLRAVLDGAALDADLRQRMERLAEAMLPLRQRSDLHFALADLADQGGAHDAAFDHYRRANELRRRALADNGERFDLAAHAYFVDSQVATFTAEFFLAAAALGDPSELPVYIVGMPRSGTTLCEQILASHPQVHALGEQLDVQSMARQLPDRIAAARASPSPPYPTCVRELAPPVARAMTEGYLERLRRVAPHAARVTDKHPTNFRHLGLIATLLPGARIIHCRRDPMDTCFSCFTQNFDAAIPWAWDLATLGQYFQLYHRLMGHWRRVLPAPIFEFVYEDAVRDPEGTARRLVEFCGLPWDERCLRFHETERPVLTASKWQVRRPVYDGSVGRWRPYARHLTPLRAALEGASETAPP